MEPVKVLFVCHGNICRSTMAEFVMRDMVDKAGMNDDVLVASAATSNEEIGNDTHPGTKRVLDKNGIPYTCRAARRITKRDYDDYDYIIGMDSYNMRNMQRIFGGDPQEKLSSLLDWAGIQRDVADPWYTGDFDKTFDDVEAGCIGLLEHIRRSIH